MLAPAALAANQNHPASIDGLRDRIARLERRGGATASKRGPLRPITLGVPELDRHLPWGGLPRAALHEVAGEGADREEGAAAAGFAAHWLAALQESGPVLWIVRAGSRAAIDLHGHGLNQQRLDPKRLILVAARRDDEALWAMEEGLKAQSLGAVLGEIEKLDLTASRRLQLAAEAGGVTAFALRRWRLAEHAIRDAAQPIAAVTRWRITALPGESGLRWQVDLTRCRGGKPGSWTLEKADGSDELRTESKAVAPLSGDLAPLLGGGSLASHARTG